MARRSEIGDLGLAESTPTNTEIAINYKKNFANRFRGKILQIVSWQNLAVH
jgi:hypothetical protein